MIPILPKPVAPVATRPGLQLRAGDGARLVRNPTGQAVSMQGADWHHPWFTKAYFWPSQNEWVAVVRPGFVNGRCPSVLTTADRMKATPTFLAPITAWDGAADIAQAARLAEETEKVDGKTKLYVPLYRNPLLSLPYRELGLDAPIPLYFVRRGVVEMNRRVVSSDIVLHQPRTALTSQIDFPVDYILGTSIVTQTLSERTPAPNDSLKIISTAQFDPVQNNNYDPGTGDWMRSYEEQTWDETLIATVYLVSPPGAKGNPDGSWMPFVAHKLFWNLNWSQPRLQPPPNMSVPGALTASFSVLAGGVGQLLIGSIMGSINDMMNAAANIVSANSLAGNFWTPTGGGADAVFPDPPEDTTDTFGFDKTARSKAKRAKAIKAGALIDKLDPAFPHNAIAFPISLLN